MSNEYKDWYDDLTSTQKENYKLCTKYPFLIPRTLEGNIDKNYQYEYMSIELPQGWMKLFLQMCDDIKVVLTRENLIDDVYFLQVKEKYNELVCYTNYSKSKEINNIIGKYRYLSRYICTECGKPALYESEGYLASFCSDCWTKHQFKIADSLNFIPEYTITNFADNSRTRIDVSNDWSRYLKENGYEHI